MKAILLVVVLSMFSGCSYTATEYRRNVLNSGATRMGYDLDSNAEFWDRSSLRRHISMARINKMPVYGDSTGYLGFIFNESSEEAVSWRIVDADGVTIGSGRLQSVWEARQDNYRANYVVDSLKIPYGKYHVVWDYRGHEYAYDFKIPSPSDSPFGKKGHWHVSIK